MLDLAIKYKDQLKELFTSTWLDDKYKFFNCSPFYEEHNIEGSTWNRHDFVSLDEKGDIIGFIGYEINRTGYYVDGIGVINFTDNHKLIFAQDLKRVLVDIFEKFNFRKIVFSVVVGNPVEASYDKLVELYGGRIVGTYKEHAMLYDGTYYDYKMYEIFREDYLRSKGDRV